MSKNLRTLMCVLICLIAMSVFGMYAFAATDGYYTYEIENNKAAITDVDTAISGDITIPSTLGGYSVVTATDNAFVSCKNITSVTIPKTLTALGPFVFSDCSSLTSITVQSGNVIFKAVDGILYSLDGKSIFCYPAGKTAVSFTVPSGVTSITNNAFSYCSNLTSITIPKSVTSIHSNAFLGCSLTSVTVASDNTSYKSEDGVLYTKDGKTLVYYPAGKSDACFTIPDGVTGIGDSAFQDCSNLKSVIIPNSVTSIGYQAFSGCSGLTDIIIPNSVTTISKYALKGCSSLTIYAEAASKPSGWSAYWNSSNRPVKWGYDPTIKYYTYTITDGKATITDVDTAISGDITVPSKLDGYPIVAIGDSAFASCKNLTGVTIPNGVTSIGYQAFAYCDNLTSISIPDSVTSIGSYVFSLCSSLSGITIPNGVTSISERAFQSCSSLTSIIIPDSVTSIGRGAFANCSSLTSISIPNSVTSIGGWAFASCSSLESITIPNGVTSIGDGAFRNCTSLTSITIHNGVTSISERAFQSCSSLTSITIPDSVTTIGDDAFYGCSSLTSITIPNSVITIGNSAFSSCSSLTDITVEDGNTVYKSEDGILYTIDGKTIVCYPGGKTAASFAIPYGVTSIGNYAFASCDNLTSITIPNSVTSIGEGAFCDCSSLTSITIPNGVTSISERAFQSCSSLTSITIPNSVITIGNSAFSSCSSLTSITIPNSVITIGDNAFGDCSNLTKIIIPRSVTSIGQGAFILCDSLINIYIPDSVTSIGTYAFGVCQNPIVICVEAESKPEGWADDWNGYNGYVSWGQDASLAYYTWEITDGKATITDVDHAIYGDITIPATIYGKPVVAIGDSAFADCDNIAAVIIPDSVTSIGFGAFSCCGLTSVTIPAGVTSIGFHTFDLCTRLASIIVDDDNTVYKSVDGVLYSKDGKELICHPMGKGYTSFAIPEGVTTLGPHAFYFSRLTEVVIPDSVTTIGTDAFSYCYGLTKIIIPVSVTTIGINAFSNCYGLTEIIIPVSVTTIRDYAFQSCYDLTIYAEAESQPAGWNSNWNPTNCPVVWGYVGDSANDNTITIVPDEGATDTEVSATIGKDLLEQIATVKDSVLQFTSGLLDMTFNNSALDALKAIVDAITDVVVDTIELVAENITSQVDENKLVFDLSVAVNGTKRPHTDFTNNGANADAEVEVEIPVDSLTVGENQTVKVFYRDGSAYGKDMDAEYDKSARKVRFRTKHFSEYEVRVVNEGMEPAVSVTNPTNGTAINHSIVATESGWDLTLAATDTTKTYVYMVKYTDANGVVSTKVANTDGKYTNGAFIIPADATDITVESALLGDTNGDAYIDSSDALLVLKYSVGSEIPSDMQRLSADVNYDGYCDSSDALLILKYSVGSITVF